MHRIVCEDCKKLYDFDKEDFCPRCGAFNQPVKTWGTDSQGNFIRVDGLNERGHAGSFVHREVHKEKSIRKAAGLDWERKGQARPRQQASQPRQTAKQPPRPSQPARKQELSSKLKAFFVLLAIIIFFNLILPILFALL